MKNITYISAGAGSGKTHRLIHQVADLLESDKDFRPEQLILTTFTKKAAAELKNKLRSLLCENGKYELAAELDNALIGTVHSIGFQLISKYWYYCKLSPKMNVLDDDSLKGYINSTLAECASEEDIAFFDNLIFQLDPGKGSSFTAAPLSWRDDVKNVIENAHCFGITDFTASFEASLLLIVQAYTFKEKILSPKELKDLALDALKDIKKNASNITNKRSLEKARRILNALPTYIDRLDRHPDKPHTYLSIKRFIKEEGLTKSPYGSDNVILLQKHLDYLRYAPDIVNLYKEYVSKIFDIADKWQQKYIEYKEKHNILDYNDIEKKFISLLRNDEVLREIQSEYRYLMVDEFQDSNSNQIEIFTILSQNVKHSYWVGDSKQAIYGFRGTNTLLIENVIQKIQHGVDGCVRDKLKFSYRSVPELVDFANDIFTQVFKNLSDVKLLKKRQSIPDIEPLLCYQLEGENKEERADKVAALVSSLISDPRYKRYLDDKKGLANFAILARKGNTVIETAKALQRINIPVSVSTKPKETHEFRLLSAVLGLCMDNSNNLSKAIIAYLTSNDFGLGSMIDHKIDFDLTDNDQKDWLIKELPIIENIIAFSKVRNHMGVGSYVAAAIEELGLDNYSSYWSDGNATVWQQLTDAAIQYESSCATLGQAATLRGFLNSDFDSSSSAPAQNAVQVMTYHTSKGLDWPVVILLSLDDDHVDDLQLFNKSITGIMVHEDVNSNNHLTLFPKISTDTVHPMIIQNLIDNDMLPKVREKVRAEESRLLYVGVTRAADQLILVSPTDKMNWFDEQLLEDATMLPKPQPWEGTATVQDANRSVFPSKSSFSNASTVVDDHRFVSPSSTKRTAPAEKVADIGQRINGISDDSEEGMANIGNCLHQIYCCIEGNHSTYLIENLLEQYGLTALKPQASVILSNWDALVNQLSQIYGSAVCTHHELEFKRAHEGHIITGSIDLVWRTSEGDVVIDYKTFPGKTFAALDADNAHYAGRYAGQFDHYRQALEADNHKVIDQLVFYPSIGMLVRIKQ